MKNVGFISSSIAHVVILGWGLVSLPSPETHDVTELEILPIELVSISDVTDVRKGDAKGKPAEVVKEATKKAPEPKKPEEKKPDPKPKPVTPPKPKERAPKKQPEPAPPKVKPKPEPTPEAKVAPAPEPEPKVQEPKEAVPKAIAALPKLKPKPPKKPKAPKKVAAKKPVKKKRSFDSNALKALANKADQAAQTVSGTDDQQASLGSRTGKQAAAMTQSELDALRAQVAQCWSPPAGAADASQLRVRIEFGLDRQGNVTSGPEPIEFPASKFGIAASESAMRAVRRCAPYSLPADKYDAWRRVRITFDPQEMF